MNAKLDKARNILKSYVFARTHSPKGEVRRLIICGLAGLLLGVGMAVTMKAQYDAEDKAEALQKQLMQDAIPPSGRGEKRWLALEQIKLILGK